MCAIVYVCECEKEKKRERECARVNEEKILRNLMLQNKIENIIIIIKKQPS